jgi:hypothetical protein
MLSKKTTMSVSEFLNKDNETIASKIIKNKTLKKITVILLGSLMYSQKVFAAGKGPDAVGYLLLNFIRKWAFWILLLMCIVEVVRAGVSGDSKKIMSIIMKFILIFASMYIVPEIFTSIRDSF